MGRPSRKHPAGDDGEGGGGGEGRGGDDRTGDGAAAEKAEPLRTVNTAFARTAGPIHKLYAVYMRSFHSAEATLAAVASCSRRWAAPFAPRRRA